MLKPYDILNAMDGIEEEKLAEAGELLELGTEPKRGFKFPWKAVLIAAVISALFTVTAYSLGWFGIGARSYETEPALAHAPSTEQSEANDYWKSANGYKGSNEYKASAEWTAYYWKNNGSPDADFLSGAEKKYADTCHFYGATNQKMADRLLEIADKYNLKLHYDQLSPLNTEDFYNSIGTEAFLPQNCQSGGYVYEDGSFKWDCFIPTGEPEWIEDGLIQKGLDFTLFRHMAGTLVPWFSPSEEPDSFEEWEYENLFGNKLIISYNGEKHSMIASYSEGQAFIELSAGYEWSTVESPEQAEEIADLIDFHKAAQCKPDLSALRHGPTVCTEPCGAVTAEEFSETPEGRAAAEYGALCGEIMPEDNSKLLAIGEKYQLEAPESFEFLYELSLEEALEKAGFAENPSYSACYPECLLSNGCVQFSVSGGTLCYIPKGALCTVLNGNYVNLTKDAESWFYKTEHGDIVHISVWSRGNVHGTEHKENIILFESEKGYAVGRADYYNSAYELETFADDINFKVFR